LSRPRQRGKSARQARGGYVVAYGSGRGGRDSWGSSTSRIDPSRSIDHGGRSIRSHGMIDGGPNRSYGSRDRDAVLYGVRSGRQFSSPEKSYGSRSSGMMLLSVIIAILVFSFPFLLLLYSCLFWDNSRLWKDQLKEGLHPGR
jgi:hypothetical protein